jgi:cytochrome c oxidase cbb3-type subunit I
MWVAGIMQGLMWREYGADGYLVYAFSDTVAAMWPMYVMRVLGGLLYLSGACVLVFNMWMTIIGRQRDEAPMGETVHDSAKDRPIVSQPTLAPAE